MLNNNKKQETQFFGTKCGNANSIAAGYATETTNYGEIATGILNKSTKGDNPNSPEGVVGDPKATLFSVGCGTKEERKNALEVKGDGSVIFSSKEGFNVSIDELIQAIIAIQDQPSVDLSEYVKSNEIYQCIKKDYDSSKRGADCIAIDDSAQATGENAIAIGYKAKATNDYSIAFGPYAHTPLNNAIAIGNNAEAIKSYTIAIGSDAQATENMSLALGCEPQATGKKSIALGFMSQATKENTIALGTGAQATGDGDTSVGYNTQATGGYSTALGYNTQATGEGATALGNDAKATYVGAIALGRYAQAIEINATALGCNAVATKNSATAMGSNARATGENAIALGYKTEAIGNSSIALGYYAKATGENATALGGGQANGLYSVALGIAEAKNNWCIALGGGAITSTVSKYALGGADDNKLEMFNIEEITYSQYGNKKYLIGLGGYDGTNLTVTNNNVETLNPNIKSVQEIINEKADLIPIVTSTDATISLQPNKKYEITAGDTLVLTFTEPSDKTHKNEYLFSINTGNSVSTITFPIEIIWDVEPVIAANKHYEINVQYSQDKYWGTVHTWNIPS